VKRLLEARARKDIRAERLNAHKRRIASHRDLVTFDIGEPLRKSFTPLRSRTADGERSRDERAVLQPVAGRLNSGRR
jgi:hypothetical protein